MFKTKKKAIEKILSQIIIKKMIEIGCGLGHTLSVFKSSGIDNIGIDISQNAISVCKKKGLNVKLQSLEDVNETYDLVSSDGLLEHLLNFEPVVQQLTKISSCFILLIQPNHNSFWGKTVVYISSLLKGEKNVYEYNYRIEDFINTFKKYNFHVIKSIPVFSDVFRLLLFKKG
jgi:2-polyprenyl-3-methyl-5-hydroxy-6-metoxy-1,4-benzoquinol methylase